MAILNQLSAILLRFDSLFLGGTSAERKILHESFFFELRIFLGKMLRNIPQYF